MIASSRDACEGKGAWRSTFSTDDDLDLSRIAESGQCFRWEELAGGGYRIVSGSRCTCIQQVAGDRRAGDKLASIDADTKNFALTCDEAELESYWKDYLDLQTSYQDIRHRVDPDDDQFLFGATQAEKGIRILRQDPWEMLVSFIISQNRNIPAIKRSIELLCERAGDARADQTGQAYFAFPTPEAVLALGAGGLDGCKLGYRGKYVLAAADAVASGETNLEALAAMDADEAIETLMGLYGVGLKVASCVALFGLHQLDAFPVDVWMRRVLENEYPNGYPREHYSPYNGVYQQYMFAHYRNRS